MRDANKPPQDPETDDHLALPWRRDLAIFLDVDGTLLDHVADPAAVRVSAQLDATLRSLQRASEGAVAMVSGRAIADLDRIFGFADMPCAGQHGLEIRTADGNILREEAMSHLADAVVQALARTTADMPGVLIENKGLSVALHYRQAPRMRDVLQKMCAQLARELGPDIQLIDGNHAFEFKPARTDKGHAIRVLMDTAPFRGRTPLFLGDDRTDEDGFAAVNALEGYSVKVGQGPSVARFRAPSPALVRKWLEDFADYLEGMQP